MARTGNFGRQPRSSPSITSTLISIAREQQAREDQNIMDAWQKGGMVDGVQVTDEMVLEHWNARLVDISDEDPLYDTYKNSVLQLEYSIASSKMTAKYALIVEPTPGDNMKMANFYLNWAKKVPKNSEFYRVLQRDAGQYMRAAKAKRVRQERDRSEEIYRGQMTALERKNERVGQTALRVLTMLAQGPAAVIGESPLGNIRDIASRSNLSTLSLGGVEPLMNMLATVMNDGGSTMVGGTVIKTPGTANSQVLYNDENGQPVTGTSLIAQFKGLDPSFDGNFNLAYVQGAIESARDGIQKRIALAEKTGHVAEASALSLDMARLTEASRQVDAYPVAVEYRDLHEKMKAVYNNNFLLPDAKVAAISAIRAEMGVLAKDKRISEDARMQEQLQAEAEGRAGVSTLGEDLAGDRQGYGAEQDDIANVNAQLELYQAQKDAVDAGEMVYTQGVYQPDPITGVLGFVAQTNGPSVGAASMSAINNLPGAGQPVPVMVPNGDGGGATPMYVVPAPIMVNAKHPNGEPMGAANANPAGSFISYMVNGKQVTLYSVTRGGTTSWTNDPPWDANMVKTKTVDGVMTVELQSTPTVAAEGLTTNGPIPGAPGFEVQGAQQKDDGTWTYGQVVFNPQVAVTMTDPARVHAGPDSFTDSFSASLAAVKESPDGQKLLTSWTGDERFNRILEHNAHMAAGQTFNSVTGTWDGGDPAQFMANMGDVREALADAKGGVGYVNPSSRDKWVKDKIDLTPDAVRDATLLSGPREMPGGYYAANAKGEQLLPSTVIQNEKEARFSALGFTFMPGGSQLNAGKLKDDRMSIKSGAPITLPSVNISALLPGGAPAPAPGPAPSPTQSVNPNAYTPPTYTPGVTPYQSGYGGNTSGGSSGGGYGNGPAPV